MCRSLQAGQALVLISRVPIRGMLATMTRYIVANVVYSNRPRKTARIVRAIRDKFAAEPDRVVWLLVETKRGRVRRWLGRGWRAHQGWLPGRSNNAVAWASEMPAPRREGFHILTWPKGNALLPRWMNHITQQGEGASVVVHQPPSRYQSLVPGAMDQMSDLFDTLGMVQSWGGDKNQAPVREWAQERGLHYRETGVMFFASTRQISRFQTARIEGWDHAVLIVDVADS